MKRESKIIARLITFTATIIANIGALFIVIPNFSFGLFGLYLILTSIFSAMGIGFTEGIIRDLDDWD